MSGWADPLAWFVLAALPGHVSWLLWLCNHIHALPWPHRLIKACAYAINSAIFFFGGTAAAFALARLTGFGAASFGRTFDIAPPWRDGFLFYGAACIADGIWFTLPWLYRRLTHRDPAALLANHTQLVDVRPLLVPTARHTAYGRFVTSIPFNQSLKIAVHEKRIALRRLPPELEGLRIAHFSDIHLTGRIDRRYFEQACAWVNRGRPDLVLLTGDLLESDVCRDWIGTTFGALRATHGAYFIFGNHDIRVDHERTRRELTAAGLVDVGRRPAMPSIRGVEVVLAGNSLPWIRPACDMAACPPRGDDRPQFRILLSHSPDQIEWARRHDFDLMLAGHVHGGQIQIPPLGPVLAPSHYGVRYACGLFDEPPTVMHVSRGLSSKLPLRFFCPPEVTTLVLERQAD